MPRTPPTPAEIVRASMDGIARTIRNLLIDNPNLRPGPGGAEAHHVRTHPRTAGFVADALRPMAEALLDRVASQTELVVAMAADPDIPGLVRSYEGTVHDRRVRLAPHPDGNGWSLSITVPDAFHDGDDVEGDFPDEASAIAAARAFVATGEIPEALGGRAAPAP